MDLQKMSEADTHILLGEYNFFNSIFYFTVVI